MSFVEVLGTLNIPMSSSATSTYLSQSGYGKYDVLGIFAPPSMSGFVYVEATYNVGIVDPSGSALAPSWSRAIGVSGTPFIVSGGQSIMLESFPYDAMRLSGSKQGAVSGALFTVTGQMMGTLTGPALFGSS